MLTLSHVLKDSSLIITQYIFMTINESISEKLLTHNDWFDGIVARTRELQAMFAANTIPNDVKKVINTFIVGDGNQIAFQGKVMSQQHFVQHIISDYVQLIQENKPIQMAFSFTDNEVLVWAEIKDNDWDTEKALILAAAKINFKYHNYGYDMTTVLVEECDELPIPNHYKPFITK